VFNSRRTSRQLEPRILCFEPDFNCAAKAQTSEQEITLHVGAALYSLDGHFLVGRLVIRWRIQVEHYRGVVNGNASAHLGMINPELSQPTGSVVTQHRLD